MYNFMKSLAMDRNKLKYKFGEPEIFIPVDEANS